MAPFVNHLYEVIGRNAPTEKIPSPQIFRMKLYAHNKPIAMSRFWYFLAMLNKSKSSTGEIISVREIHPGKTNAIKNYGIQLRYNSRSGTHNMYKEYRDVSINAAVDKMYSELASRHRARRASIWIIGTTEVPATKVKRPDVQQYATGKLRFKLHNRVPRPNKVRRSVFKAVAPSTFF